jgi:hypothetical protein
MKQQYFVCVAPSGNLELWWQDESSYWGDHFWTLKDEKPESCDITEIEENPEFWGREVIDTWTE